MRFPCSENVRCPGGVPSTASAHGCPPRGCEQNWAHSTSRATSGLGGAPPTPAPPPTADVSQPTDSGRCRGRCANTSTPPSRLRCNCSGTGNRGGRGGVSPRRAHPKDAAGCPVSRPEWGEADLHSWCCNCPTKTHSSAQTRWIHILYGGRGGGMFLTVRRIGPPARTRGCLEPSSFPGGSGKNSCCAGNAPLGDGTQHVLHFTRGTKPLDGKEECLLQ